MKKVNRNMYKLDYTRISSFFIEKMTQKMTKLRVFILN